MPRFRIWPVPKSDALDPVEFEAIDESAACEQAFEHFAREKDWVAHHLQGEILSPEGVAIPDTGFEGYLNVPRDKNSGWGIIRITG